MTEQTAQPADQATRRFRITVLVLISAVLLVVIGVGWFLIATQLREQRAEDWRACIDRYSASDSITDLEIAARVCDELM